MNKQSFLSLHNRAQSIMLKAVLCVVLLTSFTVLQAAPGTIIVTGGSKAGTYNASDFSSTTFKYFYDATKIEVAGDWTADQLGGLRNSLKNKVHILAWDAKGELDHTSSGFYDSSTKKYLVNYALTEADLSNMTLSSGDFTKEGFIGLFLAFAGLKKVTMPTTVPNIPISLECLFYGPDFIIADASSRNALENVIDLSAFTNITNLNGTFCRCRKLPNVILSTAINPSAGVNMKETFTACEAMVGTLDISRFEDISKLEGCFNEARNLSKITFASKINVSTGVNMRVAFCLCVNLTEIENLDRFGDISILALAFENCQKLPRITFSTEINTSTVVSAMQAFKDCHVLERIDNLDRFPDISNLQNAFRNCYKLPRITFSETANTSTNVTMAQAFQDCHVLEQIDNLDRFIDIGVLQNAFLNCYKLPRITFSETANTSTNITMKATFKNCHALKQIDNLDRFSDIKEMKETFLACHLLESVTFSTTTNTTKNVDATLAFSECYNLRAVNNFERFTLSGIALAFNYCLSLTSISFGMKVPTDYPDDGSYAFPNANPNILIYMPAGTTIANMSEWEYHGPRNFIIGNKASDDPVAYKDIKLVDNNVTADCLYGDIIGGDEYDSYASGTYVAPFHCPLEFSLKSGKKATYKRNFTDKLDSWQTITLPFDAKTTGTMDPCIEECDYYTAIYTSADKSGNLTFVYSDGIFANTPQIVKLTSTAFNSKKSAVTFTSTGTKVPATPTSLTKTDEKGRYIYNGTLDLQKLKAARFLNGNTNTYTSQSLQGALPEIRTYQTESLGNELQPFRAHFTPGTASENTLTIAFVERDLVACYNCGPIYVWLGKTYDWQDENNWYPVGVPSDCSDVYIPGVSPEGSSTYYFPNLYRNKEDNQCNRIYFLPGAQLGQPQLLTYVEANVELNYSGVSSFTPTQFAKGEYNSAYEAFVAKYNDSGIDSEDRVQFAATYSGVTLDRGKWNMISSPLQGISTGDFGFSGFPQSLIRKFDITATESSSVMKGTWANYSNESDLIFAPGQGFGHYYNPYITNTPIGMDNSDGNTQWTAAKNANSHKGTTTPAHIDGESSYGLAHTNGILHFPFYEDQYLSAARRGHEYDEGSSKSEFHYYWQKYTVGDYLTWTGNTQQVVRTGKEYNFIFETTGWTNGSGTYTLPGTFKAGDLVLVGNPYMSALDFDAFYAANNAVIKEKNYQIYQAVNNYANYSTAGRYIAPMQSFLVEVADGHNGSLSLTFNAAAMAVTNTGTVLKSANDLLPDEQLTITASHTTGETQTTIRRSDDASDSFCNEDFSIIIDKADNMPRIYTLASITEGGTRAVYVNSVQSNSVIVPIGLTSAYNGDIMLTVDGMSNYDAKVYFIDAIKGIETEISGRDSYNYSFSYTPTASSALENRFSLRFAPRLTGLDNDGDKASLVVSSSGNDLIVISSDADPIQTVTVYDLQGRLLTEQQTGGVTFFKVENVLQHAGIYIAKIQTSKGMVGAKVTK